MNVNKLHSVPVPQEVSQHFLKTTFVIIAGALRGLFRQNKPASHLNRGRGTSISQHWSTTGYRAKGRDFDGRPSRRG